MKKQMFAFFVLVLCAQLALALDLVPEILNGEHLVLGPGQHGTLEVGIQVNDDQYPNPFGGNDFDVGVQAQGGVGVSPPRRTLDVYGELQANFDITCPQVNARQEYALTISADVDNSIREDNENNNVIATTVVCDLPNLSVREGSPAVNPPVAHGGNATLNVQGESISINVIVLNSGTATGRAFAVRATPQGMQGVPQIAAVTRNLGALDANAQAQVSFGFICPEVSERVQYAVEVVADSTSVVAESNENDNVLSPLLHFTCEPFDENANCRKCNYDCRITADGGIPPACDTLQCSNENCPNACKVELNNAENAPQVCMQYLGAGAGADAAALEIEQRQAPYNDRTQCKQCPEQCRVKNEDTNCGLDARYYDCSLQNCTNGCRKEVPAPSDAAGSVCRLPINRKQCLECPMECRIKGVGIDDGRCAGCGDCTGECKAELPSDPCGAYADCPTDCISEPKIMTECAEMCSGDDLSSGVSKTTPASFITKLGGAEGGGEEKNVGVLMLPAVILPLFNIVIIISFVRILSPVLGGEVEIPGLAKLI